MLLAISSVLLAALMWSFGRKRLGLAGVLWWPYMGVSGWLLGALLWPVSPVLAVAVVALAVGVPVLCLSVVGYDMVRGAFPADTFFGLIPALVAPPVLFVLNGVLTAVL